MTKHKNDDKLLAAKTQKYNSVVFLQGAVPA
jgi:hypothetical protein